MLFLASVDIIFLVILVYCCYEGIINCYENTKKMIDESKNTRVIIILYYIILHKYFYVYFYKHKLVFIDMIDDRLAN